MSEVFKQFSHFVVSSIVQDVAARSCEDANKALMEENADLQRKLDAKDSDLQRAYRKADSIHEVGLRIRRRATVLAQWEEEHYLDLGQYREKDRLFVKAAV